MHPLGKVLIGVILLLIPLGLYANEIMSESRFSFSLGGRTISVNLLGSLWTVVQGIIPPLILIIGLFIIWLELDEWRIERELKMEEEKAKKKKKGKKK